MLHRYVLSLVERQNFLHDDININQSVNPMIIVIIQILLKACECLRFCSFLFADCAF
jgi:hypothetical protein